MVLVGLGEEVLAAAVRGEGGVEQPVAVGAEADGVTDVVAVHHGAVYERRVLVQLLAGAWKERNNINI